MDNQRLQIATQILSGMLANSLSIDHGIGVDRAYQFADALIAIGKEQRYEPADYRFTIHFNDSRRPDEVQTKYNITDPDRMARQIASMRSHHYEYAVTYEAL